MDFKNVVYNAARDGKLKCLKVFLESRGKDEVEHLVGIKTHGATPLVMACRNGHYDVAEYLIEQCGADIEQPGSVVVDGETIEGAPPLWCAAAAGHAALVRLLVKKGANVNSTTKTNSTPLRAACFDGHLNIVRYLVYHGADIEMANRHGHTSLMIACFKGHIRIAMFLLRQRADVNRQSARGNTALHDCAESGSLEIVKVLIQHHARMYVDSYGMTPLLAAAVTGHKHIVEYFISIQHFISREECIDALELLGATYVDKKRDTIGALELWKRAMDERYRPDRPVVLKSSQSSAIAAYNYTREISDPDALDDLVTDPDEVRMQALVIRERILGPAHPDTSYYIRYRGAVYADSGEFNRCIELWNYALDIQQSMLEPLDPMTQSSLTSFTQLFSLMLWRETTSTGRRVPPVQTEELIRVFKKAVLEVKLGKQILDKAPTSDREIYFNRVLVITLHLACLLTREIPEEGTEKYIALHKAIYELVQINAKGKNGRDVLQLIHSGDTSIGHSSKFPSPHLASALIKVSADVTARDNDGNTALHLTALSRFWRPDLAIALLEAGAHIDTVNNEGKTFETLLYDKRLYDLVNPVKYTTLACLAARVVRRTYRIENLPKHLQAFVQMH
ncbi:protein fem-1 homolog C isoform X2 [Colletes gigas]|uniref:protein fem-1 homolog C isoform X2 n=1 Tax=Colletes gigas TaxID=935657 RepID=UPI001C9AA05E|nr:protein fem-1 homolog C isoform X2 [Colletes gigas]